MSNRQAICNRANLTSQSKFGPKYFALSKTQQDSNIAEALYNIILPA